MIHPRKLLVEGATEQRVVPYLVEKNGVTWKTDGRPVVHIQPSGGVEKLLGPGVFETEFKASGLEALGLVVDADGDAGRRWTRIKTRCKDIIEALPNNLPEEGLVCVDSDGIRFGVWVMPNNRYSGALEEFLIKLIPDESRELHELARSCVSEAATARAPFKAAHTSKAELHTWLAWQDEPGKQLHEAVSHRVLNPEKPESRPFVEWFRSLFLV